MQSIRKQKLNWNVTHAPPPCTLSYWHQMVFDHFMDIGFAMHFTKSHSLCHSLASIPSCSNYYFVPFRIMTFVVTLMWKLENCSPHFRCNKNQKITARRKSLCSGDWACFLLYNVFAVEFDEFGFRINQNSCSHSIDDRFHPSTVVGLVPELIKWCQFI